ncbi:hypothetical protein EVAR_865_1 [Eumeta japonica]|uniref:Uncharacterized protein n=1 Tax=Eumeta variegata TaxID=151549 RepID=A0A4C1SGL3_EUMVA|nr:hypothetical protein EVAR_865_1 [Eumeta japonica]
MIHAFQFSVGRTAARRPRTLRPILSVNNSRGCTFSFRGLFARRRRSGGGSSLERASTSSATRARPSWADAVVTLATTIANGLRSNGQRRALISKVPQTEIFVGDYASALQFAQLDAVTPERLSALRPLTLAMSDIHTDTDHITCVYEHPIKISFANNLLLVRYVARPRARPTVARGELTQWKVAPESGPALTALISYAFTLL